MSTIAFVFPGQGSQYVGMGKDLNEQSSTAQELFRQADAILNVPLSRLCFEGPEEELRQTKNTQPAIFLHSMALAMSYRGPRGAMAAGHSLGEYSALVYAGALTWEDGLRLVRLRGELMQQAGVDRPGTMAAIIGLDPKTVVDACERALEAGIVQAANFNSPGQIVISGSVPGVRRAMELAKERGAKLVKELPVSGAFHSPLMESAQEGLKEALENTPIRDASIPVYANVTAQPVRDAGGIRQLLLQQLTSPVRWEESVAAMASAGASTFVEIGPGKVLQGLVKRILPNVALQGIDKYSDLP
ncbi:MAG: [acyl-carrier-protein] S-malonyltransferase [Ignavibacteria bacterium GWA2_55_25]|nr:MAG: [acyl-carrier-protein] S-malonyltransferase [Ignavibacteria bacterium GWA2_55_25]